MAHTTNYRNAFITVADGCPATTGEVPPSRDPKSVAQIQYEMVIDHPYKYTSDDVIYISNGERRGIGRDEFFAKGQACFRDSPLTKRYGWGVHSNADGKIALYPVNSDEYTALANDPEINQVRGMRASKT